MYRNYNLNILDAARFPPRHFTSIILFKKLTQLVSEHPLLNVTQKMPSTDLVVANNMPSLSLEAKELITKHYIEQILSPQERRAFLELYKPQEVSAAPKDDNELTIAARSAADDTKELTRQLTTCTYTGCNFLFLFAFAALTIYFIIPCFGMTTAAYIDHIQSRENFVCFFCFLFGSSCISTIFITFWYDSIAISLRFRSGTVSREERTHGSFIGIPVLSIFTGKFRFSLEYAPVVKLFLLLFSLCLFVGVMGIYFRFDQAGVASANAFSRVLEDGYQVASVILGEGAEKLVSFVRAATTAANYSPVAWYGYWTSSWTTYEPPAHNCPTCPTCIYGFN